MKPWYDRLHEKFASTSIKKNETAEDIRKWQDYLKSLPEPKDAIEASYAKYKCRMYHFSALKRFVMNVLGIGALFVELFYIFTAKEHKHEFKPGEAVIEKARDIPDFSDIVPQMIYDEYSDVKVIENYNKKFGPLCVEARKLLIQCICRHPVSFFYIYFVYMELVTHSHILLNYNPECVYVYINERNVASPILTEMYENEGRKLCSFMHGEYPLALIMAFMSFSKYYVWDKAYIDMFRNDLRCQIGEYVVYTPRKLQKKWKLEMETPSFFCTYYFSGGSDDAVIKVAEIFKRLSEQGKVCSVRPHPRNTLHKKLLEETFAGANVTIENALELPLEKSLARTQYVVGLQSTVLSEAYVEGRQIVLDDLSDPERYEILEMQKFNVFTRPHILLSDFLKFVSN